MYVFFKQLFATPKNPYIPGWDQIDPMEVEFSGCKLRLDLPPRSGADFKDKIFTKINIYKDIYNDTSSLHWYQKDNISRLLVTRRAIVLRTKPWLNDLYYMKMTAQLCKLSDLPNTMSCFNPHHFLQVIDKDQIFCYGPNSNIDYISSYISAGCNWKLLDINSVQWIFFEAIEKSNKNQAQTPKDSTLITPIDDDVFLVINFYVPASYKPTDAYLFAYRNILDTLIPRIHLTLSPSLAEKQTKILHECGNTYPEKREPISWEPFYIEGWHKDISQKDGEKLLPYPIPQYDPNK